MIPVNFGDVKEEGRLITAGEMHSDFCTFWFTRLNVSEEWWGRVGVELRPSAEGQWLGWPNAMFCPHCPPHHTIISWKGEKKRGKKRWGILVKSIIKHNYFGVKENINSINQQVFIKKGRVYEGCNLKSKLVKYLMCPAIC